MNAQTPGPRQRIRERGQTLAEFALVAPLLMILIMGLVDLARAMESHVTLQEAARDAARYAVTGRIDCSGPPTPSRNACIVQTVANDTASLTNASSVSTTLESWAYPAYSNPPTPNSAGNQCDAVQVSVTYDYKPITPLFNFFVSHIPLSASERMVNEPFGPCS
ncbi:MAG TPA: TadE/TadG family type IV pilus assembly protein [Dehalococcoidia bacterium]|nr:TadE/TadG family type IV pilus assembly protein [Dehalococcoidia bacterium]